MSEERHLSRRRMLGTALGAAAVAGASGVLAGTAHATPGNGPGWHHHGNRVPKEWIGIQLYTMRSLMAEDADGTLGALADIGYRNVELAGTYGYSAREFRKLLDKHHLRATSSHIDFRSTDVDTLIADSKILGNRFADCAYANYSSIAEWEEFAAQLERAGAAFRKAGMRYGYHNHNHEFQKIDGVRPYDVLTSNTSWHNVHLEADLYWLIDVGVDPIEHYYRNFGRVRQFHVKDRAPGGGFADLGTGTIDFGRIFGYTKFGWLRDYIVEHDQPSDPLQTAKVGYEYLLNLRF